MKTYGKDNNNDFTKMWNIDPPSKLPSPEIVTYQGGIKIVTWSDGELIHNVSYEFINGKWECKGDNTIPINEYNKRSKPQPR